ncbi:MAG: nucleotidyl transferase AbiEii/AbiGii toxin family protein [Candidatus Paceibacterota bacterium]
MEIVFNSKFADKLSFLGGTALRLIYDNNRFSEDLDFDNFGITEAEFDALAGEIKAGLEAQGLETEIGTAHKGAYRCSIRLPEILFANELSPYKDEKILIHIDSAAHDFSYQPERKVINKFDVFSEILVTPADILLSQKIYAAMNRKRAKGRDFYDIVFLLSFARPNYEYLKNKIGINNSSELKEKIIKVTGGLDFEELARDVERFLFDPGDVKRIKMFISYMKSLDF